LLNDSQGQDLRSLMISMTLSAGNPLSQQTSDYQGTEEDIKIVLGIPVFCVLWKHKVSARFSSL